MQLEHDVLAADADHRTTTDAPGQPGGETARENAQLTARRRAWQDGHDQRPASRRARGPRGLLTHEATSRGRAGQPVATLVGDAVIRGHVKRIPTRGGMTDAGVETFLMTIQVTLGDQTRAHRAYQRSWRFTAHWPPAKFDAVLRKNGFLYKNPLGGHFLEK